MASHFLQLFKRGRYVTISSLAAGEADVATQKKRHEERERFSVAAIAFCLEHDKTFRSHFVCVVAGVAHDRITKIALEPEQWGDLVLEGPKVVLVLEFKLGALLQDHQSPAARIFSETGYGAKIRRKFLKDGKQLRYVVIGKDFPPRQRGGLTCRAVPWRSLLRPERHDESKMESDLCDCLGHLGAPVFLNRHMKKIKHSSDAKNAMSLFGSLQQVMAKEGVDRVRYEGATEWLGLIIPKAGANSMTLHGKLMSAVRPKGQRLAWVGYEILEESEMPYLSIWFYSTSKTQSQVVKRLRGGLGRVKSEGSYVFVRFPGDESADDAEWFLKVLRRVAGT